MPPADDGIDSSCTGQDVSACHRPDAIGSLHDSLSVSHLTNNPAWNCCGWRFRYRYKLRLRFRSRTQQRLFGLFAAIWWGTIVSACACVAENCSILVGRSASPRASCSSFWTGTGADAFSADGDGTFAVVLGAISVIACVQEIIAGFVSA